MLREAAVGGMNTWVFQVTGYEPNATNVSNNPDVADLTQRDDDSVSEDRY